MSVKRGLPAFILMLAICALSFACGFTSDGGDVRWFWTDVPWVASVLVLTSAAFSGLLLIVGRTRARR